MISELRKIPGIGVAIEKDLKELGIQKISDLSNNNPEDLYAKLCALKNTKIDKCMLYTFRCAVYYASNDTHDEHLLKWWNWKDNSN